MYKYKPNDHYNNFTHCLVGQVDCGIAIVVAGGWIDVRFSYSTGGSGFMNGGIFGAGFFVSLSLFRIL